MPPTPSPADPAQRPAPPAERHVSPGGLAGSAALAALARQVFAFTHVDIRQYLPSWIDEILARHPALMPQRPSAAADMQVAPPPPIQAPGAWALTAALEAQAWVLAAPELAGARSTQALLAAVDLSSREATPWSALKPGGTAETTCTASALPAGAPWLVWLPACPDLATAARLRRQWQPALPESVWLVTCAQGWPAGTLAADGLVHRSHRALHDPPPHHCRLVVGHGLLTGVAGHVQRRLLVQLAETMDPRGLLWVPDEALAAAQAQGWQPWKALSPGEAWLRPPRPGGRVRLAPSGADGLTQGSTATKAPARPAVAMPPTDLACALRRGELRLHYQPQFDLASGRPVGVEALLRWQHPTDGLLGPGALVRQAEATGGIHGLGLWVLREACQQMARWQADGHAVDRVAVNVSALQWLRPRFVDEVLATVAEAGLAPRQLMLELTESRPWPSTPGPARALLRCREAGIGLSLDDFGAGHAGLQALHQLPLTQLKIDGGLMHRVPGEPRAEDQVRHGARLAGQLGLEVVVECVQQPEQLGWLRPLGVHTYQGHVGAPAMDARAVVAHFATGTAQPAATRLR